MIKPKTNTQPKKILHLTLFKKWFDEIKSGKKKFEYREIKPYWTKRLFEENEKGNSKPKHYDFILFRNGYAKNAPKMLVKFLGVKIDKKNKRYVVGVGKEFKE